MGNVAPGGGGRGPAHPRGTPGAGAFLAELAKFVGDPYVYGAAGPTAFDCSGLVQYAAGKVGVSLPRTSEQQWAAVQHIKASDLQPGDLIFEQWPGDGPAPGHVAVYTGGGKIEEAPQPGEPVHVIPWSPGSVSAEGGRVVGYGRVPGLGGGGATLTSFPGSGLLGIPGEVTGFFSTAGQVVDWLVQPSHWVRIISGALGLGSVGGGVFLMSHAGGEVVKGTTMVPRAASLPLGILLTGTGGVLLFIAFHNLPSNVTDLPTLIAWLAAGVYGKAGGTTTAAASSSADGSSSGGGGPVLA
jgi:hypothetical protein